MLAILLLGIAADAQHRTTLTWTASSGATNYNVYRAVNSNCTGSPSFAQLATGVVPASYVDNAVTAGSEYCYETTAVNTNGESAPSNTAAALIPSGGGTLPNLGENCTNGCGIGTHIIPTSVTVTLCDTAITGCDSTIPAEQQISQYPALPLTIDATKMNFDWDTDVPANGAVVCGSLANNSDRIQFDSSAPGVYNISTHHHVLVKHLIPASHNGNGGASMTCYVTSNINATTTDPQNRYSTGQNTWPGPQCYAGSTNCYLNFFPPNPTAASPMQWEATPAGVVSATRGFPAQIPIYLLWNGGNATSTAGLATCNTASTGILGHTYQANQWSAPNAGQWFRCDGTTWQPLGSLPVFAATGLSITDSSGNIYTCPGSVTGGETASGIPRLPANTCTGSAGDSGISLTPFYAGQWVNGSPQTDYRKVQYSSARGWYYMDMNAAAPPANAQPTATLQFFPSATAISGNITVNMTLNVYADSTFTTPAQGTNPIPYTFTINVGDETPLAQHDPASYPADVNLPTYSNYLASQSIGMCSNTSGSFFSVDYYNLTIDYWMWLTFSPGDWGPYNTGNYDNSRVFLGAGDFYLRKMDGTAWPAWAAGQMYGTAYSSMEVTDTNGNVWIATVNGGVSGGSISWPSNPLPGSTKSDNTQTWRYIGNQSYYDRCSANASIPFDNQVIQTGGSAQWAQFTGSEEKHRQRTDDAIIKGTTTITGFYSKGEKAQITSDYGAGAFSQFSASAGRGPAYELMAWATYWKTVCDEGNCALFTANDEYKRMVFWQINATINYWNIHELSNPLSTDETRTYWPTFDPLHFGVGAEALIEWFIRDKELDPTNSLGLLDPRIIPELARMLDFAYFHWYNQCSIYENTNNFSMSYNPMDVQTCAILEPYFTELVGPMAGAFPFMGRYLGNTLMSDGVTTWFAAADIVSKHIYDGRNCSNPQGKWFCSQYGIPYGGGSGVPKTFGQTSKWQMNDSYQWRYGYWTPFEDDLSPQHNPCWTGGTTPCGSVTPYPDTTGPYAVAILPSGSQDDPTCEAHYTGQSCSPIQNVASTSADFQLNIYEPVASIRVDYGTDQTCTGGSTNTEENGYPRQINSNNQLYTHLLSLTGLIPNTTYYARYCATDFAGNTSCNTCTAIPGGFRGGKINFTTLTQTVLTVVTASLPNGIVGTAYSQTLTAAGGTPPYTWAVTVGSLPHNLSLNTSTGVISGTPDTAGVSSFTVQVTDANSAHATAPLSITITNLTITNSSLPSGTFNVAYSATLTGSGETLPYTWSLQLGNKPPGLNLNAATGAITGTPTACGTYPDVWKLTDSSSPPISVTKPLTITVSGCSTTLTITTASLPNGVQGTPYTATLMGTGGTGSGYTWSVIVGTLPAGLSLAASTGVISGTPTGTGTSSFTVQLRDSNGNSATAPLSITIGSSLAITTSSLPTGTYNVPYSATLTAAGGVAPYTWSYVNGAPAPGLSLNTSTGAITGTPTTCGTFGILWQVTDSVGTFVTKSIPITITGCTGNPITVTTTSLPNGVVNTTYANQQLAATGGVPPYTWSVTAGSLPTGISLSSMGVVSGTPTVTGTFSFTVQAEDTLFATGTAPLSITIISTAQLGVSVSGSTTINGSATLGTQPVPPPAGSPLGP